MFTSEERVEIRDQLIADACEDRRVTAAAVVGSAALGREDQWSDIDLTFRLEEGADAKEVADSWTARLYESHGAVHHLDI